MLNQQMVIVIDKVLQEMKVQFEATLDDFVDVTRRSMARSQQIRKWRWQNMLLSTAIAGFIVYLIMPGASGEKLFLATIGVIVAVCLDPIISRSGLNRRLRKLSRESLGSDGPVTVQVELSATGVWVKQQNIQITYEWMNVEEIQESSGSIDFFMKNNLMVAVRNRAFNSEAVKAEFLEIAQKYLRLANESQQPNS